MHASKISLMAATALTIVAAPAAQAQIAFPAVDLHGAGATTVQTAVVTSLNCVGNPGNHVAGDLINNRENKVGNNSGQLQTVVPGRFDPASPTTSSPAYDCETQEIQPDFQGKYVATGSGTGRAFWRSFSNQLPGTTASNINPFGTWNNVQFAFSEAPVTASDLTTYNANANNATNKAGAAIQFPLYAVPVTFAYNPKYGTRNGVELTFNVKSTYVATDNGNVIGGLRLSKSAYCKIVNGEITNWNDAALKTLNGNQSLMDLDDDATRWAEEGATIRLVGRLDRSGGTDVFTRHIAATCDPYVTLNKFDKAAESLPFNPASTIDMRGFNGTSQYFPGVSAANVSGTNQSISGAFFNRVTQSIVTTQGVETPGLFMVADGSSGIRDALNFAPDRASTHANGAGVLLNGKLGYIGADFVKPSAGSQLFSAALQQGTGSTYLMANAKNATAAFGKGTTAILPPQSTSTGAYNELDTRVNSVTGLPVNRANPLDWTDVLYSNPANTLANPSVGFPITGTAMFLTYTCFSDSPKRVGLVNFLALNFGKNTKNYLNQPVSSNLFKGTSTTTFGLLAQLALAPMPSAWQGAINETFLKKSTQSSNGVVLGSRNLWIQSKLPKTQKDIDAASSLNPTCTAGAGA